MSDGDNPEARLDAVRNTIAKATAKAGRRPEDVTLIAISKKWDAAAIRPLIAAGQRVFGENRVQEAAEKWPELRARTDGIELHMVGQLQSNKAEDAVTLFDAIHTIDRPSLVKALAKAFETTAKRPRLYIQVNIGEEDQKGGCAIDDLAGLIARCGEKGLTLAGLMCIPPIGKETAPYFALLAELAERHGLAELSMGMSSDYETAVMCGATHVRVGTALFGRREK